MNDAERKVLHTLSETDYYLPFDPICQEWGLERKVVRRACRSLARKGLAVFGSGLWNDDGQPAGSGYSITQAGREAIAALLEKSAKESLS